MRHLGLAILALLLGSAAAAGQQNSDCLKCHGQKGLKIDRDGRELSLHYDAERAKKSVHAKLDCTACHADLSGIKEYPHKNRLEPVDCGLCHDEEEQPQATYWQSTHGKLVKAGNPDAPRCQDCHGSHYVLRRTDPDAATSPFNIPQMCAQCHADDAKVARTYDIPQEQIVTRYRQSIHGTGLYRQGLSVTAVCTSCHTGHNVLPHDDPGSSIHRNNVAKTCMKCHGRIEQVHRKVIKGELWEKEGVVPLCVECHSPHEVRKVFYDTNMSNADCLRCHGKPDVKASKDGRSLLVDHEKFGGSIHGRKAVACAQCHTGATPSMERSCSTITSKVDCSVCHEQQVADHARSTHGKLRAAGDTTAPTCTDCHGTHEMMEHAVADDAPELLRTRVRESPTYSRNVPTLCARCHGEGGKAAVRYLGTQTEIVENYSMSIHGKGLLASGLTVTATCTDCHSSHKELPSSDPDSSVNGRNIARTCGKCHDGIYERYQQSIHSEAGNPDYRQLRGMPALPHCNDCHSSHTVARTDQKDFRLGIMVQCGKCHEEVAVTYFDTYHGKASALGDTTRAKCYDCHGAHDIHPIADPKSRLHRDNIVGTCATCHRGSHRRFAGYLTHATHHDPDKYPILFWVFWGMTALLLGTFGFFGIHTLFWLPQSWKMRKQRLAVLHAPAAAGEKEFLRFDSYARSLHLMVIVSFFGLAITGMTLKFSYTPWASTIARFLGGTNGAGWIHRVCAVITFLYVFLHLVDVVRRFRQKKQSIRKFLFGPDTILPTWHDVGEFWATMKWFVGRGPRPQYGRWTYWEKFDYFAVFWGVVVIGSTGLCLWFPELFTHVLPGWSINVATIIHSDEALLATGFIFTIHFFNTHFRPEKFPMDPVIFTGRVSVEELKHDKPRLYEELVASGELEKHLVEPAPPAFRRLVRVFGMTALVVGFALVAFIIYGVLFAYR